MASKKRSAPAEPAAPAEPVVAKPPPAKRQRKKKSVSEPETTAASEVSTVAPSVVSSTATTTVSKKSRRKKDKTKLSSRTPSSYVLFSMHERKSIVVTDPNLTLGEVSKQCGVAWKALNVEQRVPWQTQADELKAKRLEEIAEEEKINPPKKKRTPSSYLLFAMQHRKVVLQEDASLAIGEVSKKCGQVWKMMTDPEKQIWKDKAAELKEKN